MSTFLQDVRYAWRTLTKAPGFTVVAVLTLALGIGGSTAIFTVVNAVLLQPLRFSDPERLTIIWTSIHSRVPPAYVDEWRRESGAFGDVAAWRDDRVNLTGRGEPVEILADRVTPNFFTLLGVPPYAGRTFTLHQSLSAVEPEVMLSYRWWQQRYGGDPAVVGQSITLDGDSFTIIGVMPEGFAIRTLELAESRADVWIPLPIVPAHADNMSGILHVVGRLAANVSAQQGQAELTEIARRIEGKQSDASRDWSIEVVPLLEATVRDVRLALLVLSAAVVVVLLIACANVGNLMLSRDAARQTELAVRQSLGASGGRILRQLLTESVVLAAVGGVLGFLLALGGTKLLVSALPSSFDFPRTQEIGVDTIVLVFAGMATGRDCLRIGPSLDVGSIRHASCLVRRCPWFVVRRRSNAGQCRPHRV
jgi:predicted permease